MPVNSELVTDERRLCSVLAKLQSKNLELVFEAEDQACVYDLSFFEEIFLANCLTNAACVLEDNPRCNSACTFFISPASSPAKFRCKPGKTRLRMMPFES